MQLIFQTFWVCEGVSSLQISSWVQWGLCDSCIIAPYPCLRGAPAFSTPLKDWSPDHTLITTWIQGSALEFSQQWEKQILELSPEVDEQQRWLHYYPRSGNSFQFRQSLKKISTDNYWLQMFKKAESVTASILDVGIHASISMMYWMFILWLFFLHNRYSGFINMLLLTGY